MRQLSIGVLVASLLGFGMTAAVAAPMPTASADTSAAIAPLVARGPGPVINPEGSKYMEEKKAAMEKQMPQHTKQGKHHSKKKHHGKKHHKKKQ
ncbi:TPA: hypothetical protein SMI12_004088 [Serratia liquefaciens]|uniref:hypothetical protein n=1 Tax=Serratia fonticola TaxID=47917 RepID=UPI000F990664|nr:hypothetical protein [Serratia liquefaciens]